MRTDRKLRRPQLFFSRIWRVSTSTPSESSSPITHQPPKIATSNWQSSTTDALHARDNSGSPVVALALGSSANRLGYWSWSNVVNPIAVKACVSKHYILAGIPLCSSPKILHDSNRIGPTILWRISIKQCPRMYQRTTWGLSNSGQWPLLQDWPEVECISLRKVSSNAHRRLRSKVWKDVQHHNTNFPSTPYTSSSLPYLEPLHLLNSIFAKTLLSAVSLLLIVFPHRGISVSVNPVQYSSSLSVRLTLSSCSLLTPCEVSWLGPPTHKKVIKSIAWID